MAESEAEMLARWRRGDEDAFAHIVRRWQQPLARFLARLAESPDQVADLLQETFLRLHRAGARYHENGHFSAWLHQIALNVARDAARRRRPSAPLPSEVAAESAAVGEIDMADCLQHAVAELPQELREVLALRHDRGMSFEEISRMLGVPASTLKSRFTAALKRLRLKLEEFDPERES